MLAFNIHLLCTIMMAGLIWTIQVVHYPLFAEVSPESFKRYHQQHMRRITILVAPLMLGEAATGLWLALFPPSFLSPLLTWIAFGLLMLVWICTALVQVPQHGRVAIADDHPKHIRALTLGNWIRTLLWSARGLLLVSAL